MGREIKRIHVDFDLFERKAKAKWKGYLLDSITCSLCEGTGKTLNNKSCGLCRGEGEYQLRVEPYKGYGEESGYQVWQDTTEGGPVSPVFESPKDLATWMVENDDSITKDTTYEQWLKFIETESSAPSMIMSGGTIGSGVSKLMEEEE